MKDGLGQPTFVKTRHHCQCRSFRYAAQFRCRTFKALSCCCFLAKALKDRKESAPSQVCSVRALGVPQDPG